MEKKRRVALVLGGGGARGIAHIGASLTRADDTDDNHEGSGHGTSGHGG